MSGSGRAAIFMAALAASCGFGSYDDSANPSVTSANDGVADAGQWWPFVCPDGVYPIPASTPQDYSAAGSCGPGGPLTLSVDGCEMEGNWEVLGLADDSVETLQPTSTPDLGAWILSATGAPGDGGVDLGDGGTCQAVSAGTAGTLSFTCTVGAATVCQSTLSLVEE
jgi:hypothetical protein